MGIESIPDNEAKIPAQSAPEVGPRSKDDVAREWSYVAENYKSALQEIASEKGHAGALQNLTRTIESASIPGYGAQEGVPVVYDDKTGTWLEVRRMVQILEELYQDPDWRESTLWGEGVSSDVGEAFRPIMEDRVFHNFQ